MTPKAALRLLTYEAKRGTYFLRPLATMVNYGFDNPSNVNAEERLAKLHKAIDLLTQIVEEHEARKHNV